MRYFLLRLASWASKRPAIILASLFYAYIIHYAHIKYLNPTWQYFGYTYSPINTFEVFFIVILTIYGGAFVPALLKRPSSVILILLYIIVYLPTVVLSLSLETDRVERYSGILISLAIGFSLACIVTRFYENKENSNTALPSDKFSNNIFLVWLACCGTMIASFISIMAFVGLDQIYDQRALGKEGSSLFLGYTQSYFSNVFSPALMVIGLLKSRWKQVALGGLGCFLTFMIDAQKTVFLLPFVIILLHYILKSRVLAFRSTSFFLFILGMITLLVIQAQEDSEVANFLSATIVFRTLTLPGVLLTQYYDYFSTEGFTYWSHVRLVNLIVPPPSAFVGDPYWPKLGYIIGESVQHLPGNNANAHLFADTGVAAAGSIGILVISLVFTIWLYFIDRSSKGWDSCYVLMVIFPVGLFLTNGPLFTILAGYGGMFWLIVFYVYKPNLIASKAVKLPSQLLDAKYSSQNMSTSRSSTI